MDKIHKLCFHFVMFFHCNPDYIQGIYCSSPEPKRPRERRGTLEAVVQWSLQTPEASWFSRIPETEVCICVLAGSRNYYIKDLRKNKKENTIYYTPIPATVRHHVNPVISHVLPLTLALDVTSLPP
jgi:hypothetical protein